MTDSHVIDFADGATPETRVARAHLPLNSTKGGPRGERKVSTPRGTIRYEEKHRKTVVPETTEILTSARGEGPEAPQT